jgi:hypothetical protein
MGAQVDGTDHKLSMNDQHFLDFVTALGEEFCDTLNSIPGFEDIVPQDGYEVFRRVFREDPNPQFLASLTDEQLEQLRTGWEDYFGQRGVAMAYIRQAVTRTIARWPVEPI